MVVLGKTRNKIFLFFFSVGRIYCLISNSLQAAKQSAALGSIWDAYINRKDAAE